MASYGATFDLQFDISDDDADRQQLNTRYNIFHSIKITSNARETFA